MKPHPLFADIEIPRVVTLGPFRLEWLTTADVDEDYEAVTESEEALLATFQRSWPKGLTLEDNLLDLAWHQREFESARSFAWIIRDDETRAYLGCAYAEPELTVDGALDVWWWFRSSLKEREDLARFRGLLTDWLSGPPWPQMTLKVDPRIPD